MSINNIFIVTLTCIALTSCSILSSMQAKKHQRSEMVPDAETAKVIATAVLVPIYGRDQINDQMPFSAELKNGIWHVFGSLPKGTNGEVWVGGVARVAIRKNNGEILDVSHGE